MLPSNDRHSATGPASMLVHCRPRGQSGRRSWLVGQPPSRKCRMNVREWRIAASDNAPSGPATGFQAGVFSHYAVFAPSYHPRERRTIWTTDSMTGTSTRTPTTVASAAPDWNPNSAIAVATASWRRAKAGATGRRSDFHPVLIEPFLLEIQRLVSATWVDASSVH